MNKFRQYFITLIFTLLVILISLLLFSDTTSFILFEIRFPRYLMLLFSGFALSLSGYLIQMILSNPLADVSLLGINQGSGLFITISILLINKTNMWQIPIFSFLGGSLLMVILFKLSYKNGRMSLLNLLMNGVGLNALSSGIMTILMSKSQDMIKIAFINKWLTGSLWTYEIPAIFLEGLVVLISSLLIYYTRNALRPYVINQDNQQLIGFDTNRYSIFYLALSIILTTITISFIGGIGFIGMIATQIIKKLLPGDFRNQWFLAGLLGSVIMLISDTLIQYIFQAPDVPLGSIVSFIGAIYLIYIIFQMDIGVKIKR